MASVSEPIGHDRQNEIRGAALRRTARARLEAIRRSAGVAATRSASTWREVCPSYVDALTSGPTPGSTRVDTHGLTIFVPPTRKPSSLQQRLLGGRLPWTEIMAHRGCGLGGIALDIGANVGATSLVRIVGGDAQRVYAAEPEPMNYRNLVAAVVANGLEGIICPDWVALSDQNGTGTLHIGGMGNHQLIEGGKRGVSVPTMTLDTWVAARGVDVDAISFVKIDTQGSEYRILRGAPTLLAQRHITWLLEFSPSHLATTGATLEDLVALAKVHFTHAIDLRSGAHLRTRELADAVGAMVSERRYTNLILYRATE